VVLEISTHHTGQPLARFGDGCVHPPSELLLDHLKLDPHPVAARPPSDLETPLAGASTDVGEAEEIKGFRFSTPAGFPVCHRTAAKLDQPGLVRMKRQGVFCHALFEVRQKPCGIGAVEVDGGQRRRDDRPLRGAPRRRSADPVLQHTHLQPFANQAEDPPVADPPFQEAEQPIMAYRVKRSGDRLPIAGIFPIR
jgi:hypothetical protein